MNFYKQILAILVILTVLLTASECSTLGEMFSKNIQKRQETTGGMQQKYTLLLPPHVAEMFLRRHF